MSGATIRTVKLTVNLQENGIIRLNNGRYIGRLEEDDEVSFEKLAEYSNEIKTLENAFIAACEDAADDCCPHEYGFYTCDKCKDCPHDREFHNNVERDIDCWKAYYLAEGLARG